jgi:hypothetical protein
MVLSQFGKDYLLLGLRLNKHIDGYVDAFFGPDEISEKVKTEEPISPKVLLKDCESLQNNLKNQGFIQERTKFLEKMINAMKVSLDILNGVSYIYSEQVKNLYDVNPEYIDDKIFYRSAEKLDSLLVGTDKLNKKVKQFKANNTIPPQNVERIFKHALEITRNRMVELYPDLLPENENFKVEIVKNKPWGAYNWYLGNYSSKIEINSDTPANWIQILPTASHEGYPGHHAEHAIKEKVLYHEQGRFEHSILLIPTPESVMAEGIGNTGIRVLYSIEEITGISLNKICPVTPPRIEEGNLLEYYKTNTLLCHTVAFCNIKR